MSTITGKMKDFVGWLRKWESMNEREEIKATTKHENIVSVISIAMRLIANS